MGVAGYFPGGLRELQRDLKDAVAEVTRQGKEATLVQAGERYDFVEDYDPVLRAHCRLDRAG